MTLDKFIKEERSVMLSYLRMVIQDVKQDIRSSHGPDDEHDDGYVDVRLCIDQKKDSFDWAIRIGDASYDQRHSRWCAASSIGLNANAKELLNELVEQIVSME